MKRWSVGTIVFVCFVVMPPVLVAIPALAGFVCGWFAWC
jgi:hypothetical protein